MNGNEIKTYNYNSLAHRNGKCSTMRLFELRIFIEFCMDVLLQWMMKK